MAFAFPPSFAWGTASSSYQVEGGIDGCDWADWERDGHIHDGSRAGAACGWWDGKAEEDLALAAAGGQNAHRLSLEWSRLEPAPGHFDDAAFSRYERLLRTMRALGLAPMVTLHHFTLPRWVAARGSFCWDGLPDAFARYAEECARRLGAHVAQLATLNEPSVLAFMGYFGEEWPPGLGSVRAGTQALATMLVAHARARAALRRVVPDVPVGIVLNAPRFLPARPGSRGDRFAAAAQDFAFTGAVLSALTTGRLLPPLALIPRSIAGLGGSIDFLGLNYYGSFDVRFDLRMAGAAFGRHVQTPTVRTAHNDWGRIDPDGLEAQLVRLSGMGVPLYVTENGLFDPDDAVRPGYLRAHVAAVGRAIARGADVRGYFHWSLVDNFEWAEGWATPFGLFAVDRATGVRTAKRSAAVYEGICRSNGAELGVDEGGRFGAFHAGARLA